MENDTEPSLMLPAQLSTYAPEVDSLFHAISGVSLVFFVGITVTMLVFMVRYRRRRGVLAGTSGQHTVLELFWTFTPLLLLAAIFHQGSSTFVEMAMAPDDALEIRVRARQWSWEFEHPTGYMEDNQVHVPVGRPIRFVMSSSDVIHSLFIPDFRVKRDAVPGMFSSLWFEAIDPGTVPSDAEPDRDRVLYTSQIYCAEYCGANGNWGSNAGHATMYGLVHVQRQVDYDAPWHSRQSYCLNGAETCPLEESGSILFQSKTCVSCHGREAGASESAAPNLFGIAGSERALVGGEVVVADDAYLRRSVLEPRAQVRQGYSPVMPNIRVSEAELDALIAYLHTLH